MDDLNCTPKSSGLMGIFPLKFIAGASMAVVVKESLSGDPPVNQKRTFKEHH